MTDPTPAVPDFNTHYRERHGRPVSFIATLQPMFDSLPKRTASVNEFALRSPADRHGRDRPRGEFDLDCPIPSEVYRPALGRELTGIGPRRIRVNLKGRK